jgi:glycosyltransferase involved in cell wall biosynthesis
VTVIENGISGYIHTDVDYLVERMKVLLSDKFLASELGMAGKKIVEQRFNIRRFSREWEETFKEVINNKTCNHEKTNRIYK